MKFEISKNEILIKRIKKNKNIGQKQVDLGSTFQNKRISLCLQVFLSGMKKSA